jgi:hypothetical protein
LQARLTRLAAVMPIVVDCSMAWRLISDGQSLHALAV